MSSLARKNKNFIENLYESEYAQLFKLAYHKTKNRELAQDMIQETFLLALFREEELLSHPNPTAWLTLTLRNFIANEQRSRARSDISLDEAAQLPAVELETPLSDILPANLKPVEREILIWRFERQMSCQEIAERLGISVDACYKRVARAVSHCRKYLH